MTWITVATPPFGSIDKFDQVVAHVTQQPDGLEARYAGTIGDGTLRVVTLWESRAHADRFFAETLGPVLAKALGPEPSGPADVVGIDIARTFVREPAGTP